MAFILGLLFLTFYCGAFAIAATCLDRHHALVGNMCILIPWRKRQVLMLQDMSSFCVQQPVLGQWALRL